MTKAAFACLLLLAGCASTQVSLLEGEEGAATGAVAVLDPKNEGDVRVLDQARSKSSVRQRTVSTSVPAKRKPETRYAPLLTTMPEKPRRFEFFFEGDSTKMIPDSQAQLSALFAEVKRRPEVDIDIIGHTDTMGDESYNNALSMKRAALITTELAGIGLTPDRIRAIGRGEHDLRVQTADQTDSLANRRVEVYVK